MSLAGQDVSSTSSCELFCVSTVDGLSYTPSAEERSRDAAQIVATGRRSWKTLKGTGEAVWPPQLEAALIEGSHPLSLSAAHFSFSLTGRYCSALEKYQLDDSWLSKSPGRFPMRNRFISDYIFHLTGKRRSPKQVGSRLQQLKDTCKGKRSETLPCYPSHSSRHLTFRSL
jgi:TEA/ATTS domain